MIELIMQLNKTSNAALDNAEHTLCWIEKILKCFKDKNTDYQKGGEKNEKL
ncbi:MAG: hypothetical protein LBL50_03695 [Candidatus Margulisbacteria bacterium]|jgi:hypothetical protein|nr:hypothetical protein [Candidatus Margulisiibacteriota bacterium]